jgi:hypothetical protein
MNDTAIDAKAAELIRRRAADAATAVERLARSLALSGTDDQVAIAYILRILEAAARVDDYTEHDRKRVEPDPNYLGRLRGHDPGYSSGRQP